MRIKISLGLFLGCVAIATGAWQGQGQTRRSDDGRDADREAIRQAGREFADAFAKGDAKAAASQWTADGEYQDESGEVLRGRAAIEKAFAEHFGAQTRGHLEVRVESIRFPSRDSAIEEGILRAIPSGKGLPTSTRYSSFLVRDDGKWKIAASREWGAGRDRLEDLDWLIGNWKGSMNKDEIMLIFERDDKHSCLVGRFTKKLEGKEPVTGSMRIAIDPQRGQIRSWHFDADGGHGQSLWLRDGNNWVMDAIGVDGEGNEHAAVNILSRVNNDEVVWRSIDRVVGGKALPNTTPVKLVRVPKGK